MTLDVPATLQLAIAQHQAGRLAEAQQLYRQILTQYPQHPDALHLLGVAALQLGRTDDAITLIRQAIAANPSAAPFHANLAEALKQQGKLDEAVAALRAALALQPNFPAAYNNLGTALHEKGNRDEAIAAYREALRLDPNHAPAHNNLGNLQRLSNDFDAAEAAFRTALRLEPANTEALYNLALTFKDQDRVQDAIAGFRAVLRLNPNHVEAHWNLALALLQLGDYREGWQHYEWRKRKSDFSRFALALPQPNWDGSDLAGRSIFLHTEQGLGDTIQFIRYAPLVAQRNAGKVIVGCRPNLLRLLREGGVPGVDHWIAPDQSLPTFQVHCALLSLPLVMGTTALHQIPSRVPYLHAPADASLTWRQKLATDPSALKVGLFWEGSIADRRRSIALTALAPLAANAPPGTSFHSLQVGDPARQPPPPGVILHDHSAELTDFAETAGLIEQLDLVITVDTAVAHLAGAMAKPVWTMLPYQADWRWLEVRDDSPWYPTMRLFRQKTCGQWDEVIQRVAVALANFEPERRPMSS
jgi:tetratricopeptide (TPR) repeat protein